tara:strand:- start:2727 stop:2927 length:201 start_codon:yes stop_codon:yes gene_type:complete
LALRRSNAPAAGTLLTYDYADADGAFVLRLPPGAEVDLAVGRDASKTIVMSGVQAGACGLRVVRGR